MGRMGFSKRWIPKPQFWYPPLRFGSQPRIPKHLFFLVFWVSTADFGFSAGRRKFSDVFLRCLSRKSGSQHQLRIKTLPSKKETSVCPGDKPSSLCAWEKLRAIHRATVPKSCVCFLYVCSRHDFALYSCCPLVSLFLRKRRRRHGGRGMLACNLHRLTRVTLPLEVPRVRLRISGAKSGRGPETPWKRSQSKF